jgi:hypothetical protein
MQETPRTLPKPNVSCILYLQNFSSDCCGILINPSRKERLSSRQGDNDEVLLAPCLVPTGFCNVFGSGDNERRKLMGSCY